MSRVPLGLSALAAVALVGVSACDDDPTRQAEETIEDIREKAEQGGARATAEAFRISLRIQDDDDAGGVRNVQVLREAAEDVPGDPDISGISDGDGDERDDDGYVQVNVGDESACVTLPPADDDDPGGDDDTSGDDDDDDDRGGDDDDIQVSGRACPTG